MIKDIFIHAIRRADGIIFCVTKAEVERNPLMWGVVYNKEINVEQQIKEQQEEVKKQDEDFLSIVEPIEEVVEVVKKKGRPKKG